jgi:hypothetical protein
MAECFGCGVTAEREFCDVCHHERMMADIKGTEIEKAEFKFRPGWSLKIQGSKPLFDEHYAFIDLSINGQVVELAIKASKDGKFVVAIGDKQLVVAAEKKKEDARWEAGKVLEIHDPLWDH